MLCLKNSLFCVIFILCCVLNVIITVYCVDIKGCWGNVACDKGLHRGNLEDVFVFYLQPGCCGFTCASVCVMNFIGSSVGVIYTFTACLCTCKLFNDVTEEYSIQSRGLLRLFSGVVKLQWEIICFVCFSWIFLSLSTLRCLFTDNSLICSRWPCQ